MWDESLTNLDKFNRDQIIFRSVQWLLSVCSRLRMSRWAAENLIREPQRWRKLLTDEDLALNYLNKKPIPPGFVLKRRIGQNQPGYRGLRTSVWMRDGARTAKMLGGNHQGNGHDHLQQLENQWWNRQGMPQCLLRASQDSDQNLEVAQFEIRKDHDASSGKLTLEDETGKLARSQMRLFQMEFDVVHREGMKNLAVG